MVLKENEKDYPKDIAFFKKDNQQNKKATHGRGENICKSHIW